jgi:hypothetical protein
MAADSGTQLVSHRLPGLLVRFQLSSVLNTWDFLRITSALNEAVWWGFKDAGITIAFPQLDVHFDTPAQ